MFCLICSHFCFCFFSLLFVFLNCDKLASHIACKHCQALVDKRFMFDHLNEMCLKRYIDCPLCGTSVFRGKLSDHWENRCINYRIICMLCGKTFATNERTEYVSHLAQHAFAVDKENSKYELIFANHKQALTLKNEYSVYLVSNCQNCDHRVIQASVSDKYISNCIPLGCEVCDPNGYEYYQGQAQKTVSNIYSKIGEKVSGKILKLTNATKVLPHPFRSELKNNDKGNGNGNGNGHGNGNGNATNGTYMTNQESNNVDDYVGDDDENDDLYKVYDSDENENEKKENTNDVNVSRQSSHSYKKSVKV